MQEAGWGGGTMPAGESGSQPREWERWSQRLGLSGKGLTAAPLGKRSQPGEGSGGCEDFKGIRLPPMWPASGVVAPTAPKK